jgi:hypothetical protein
MLETLLGVDVPSPKQVAFAVGVEPVKMLEVGKASDVGYRSSATMSFFDSESLRIGPDDALESSGLLARSSSIADELQARLMARANPTR